jgi:SAM-dependent methyltransferase
MFRNTAHLYDLIYSGKDYETEAADVHAQIMSRKPDARTLLDVACGTGMHLAHLRQWFEIAGVDLDPGMLAVARQRLDDTQLVEADMRTFSLDRHFDAVTCLFSAIAMADVGGLFHGVANMARHLAPGGVLIVDGWVRPDRWREPGTLVSESFRTGEMAVSRTGRSWRDGRKTHLELHHLVATVGGVEHLVDDHEMTLFSDVEYRDAFTDAGLTVEAVGSPYPDRDRYIGIAPG